jgi:hypothetical protein
LLPSISNLSPTSETDKLIDPEDKDFISQEDSQSQFVDDESVMNDDLQSQKEDSQSHVMG